MMKRKVLVIILVLTIILMTNAVYAANQSVYTETFDRSGLNKYNTGNIGGQRGWSAYTAGGTVQVIEATSSTYSKMHSLMKSVELIDNSTISDTGYITAYRSIADITEGSLSVWMRAEQTNGLYQISVNEGSSIKAQVGFRSNGQISYYNGTTHTNSGVSYEANKWYRFVIEFDCGTDKYTFYAYDDVNDLLVYVTDLNFKSTASAINRMQAGTGSGDTGTYQLDDISVYETDGYGSFDTVQMYDTLLYDFENRGYHFKDNRDGELTNQESYVLESMLVMYQATGDAKYIDTFLSHVNSMIPGLDTESEIINRGKRPRDYKGLRNYGWQERYRMFGKTRLYDSNGLPSLDIYPVNFLGQTDPSWNYTFKVEDGTDSGTFKITLADFYNIEVYDNLVMDQLSSDYVETRINGISDRINIYDLSKLDSAAARPKNIDNVKMVRQGVIDINNAAMTGYPLAMYAHIVDETPALNTISKYADARDKYVGLLEEMVQIFDNDWHTSGSEGWYTYKKGSPEWCDGADVPIHSQLAFGKLLIELYNTTGTASYLTKATALANWFKNDIVLDNGSYTWHYACTDTTNGKLYNGWSSNDGVSVHTPTYSGNQAWQELNSSGIDVSFAVLAYQNGIVFDSTDIGRFIGTFRDRLYNSTTGEEGRIYSTVYGGGASSYDPEVSRWILLSQYESNYYPNDERIFYTIKNTIFEKQNYVADRYKLLGAAYIINLQP